MASCEKFHFETQKRRYLEALFPGESLT
jgi:hypothetical protein